MEASKGAVTIVNDFILSSSYYYSSILFMTNLGILFYVFIIFYNIAAGLSFFGEKYRKIEIIMLQ